MFHRFTLLVGCALAALVCGTTYGHSDETFRDPVFLEYVARGTLWAAGRVTE